MNIMNMSNGIKILGYLDKSRHGNDCRINESYAFCTCFDMYFILHIWKVTGWSKQEEVYLVCDPSLNITDIHNKWKELGGMSIEPVD